MRAYLLTERELRTLSRFGGEQTRRRARRLRRLRAALARRLWLFEHESVACYLGAD